MSAMPASPFSSKNASQHHIREEAELLARALPPLLIEAERVASIVSQGLHGRRRVGTGESFWQFRHYRPGDSAKQIDWRSSAKSDRLYIRETEWEAAQSLWLWCDNSVSMNYASAFASVTKQKRAAVLALALAHLVLRGGERIACVNPNNAVPMTGRIALDRLAQTFMQAPEEDGNGNLPKHLPLPRYGRLVLIGDFFSPLADIEACLRFYSMRGVRGHLLQIVDPAEEDLPFKGRTEFLDMESDIRLFAGRAEELRPRYQRRFAEHRDAISTFARHFGFGFAAHRTDRPAETALLGLYAALEGQPPITRPRSKSPADRFATEA